MTVGREVVISFLVNPQNPASVTLVIGESSTAAEISFDPVMVETLRDKADEAVRERREAVAKQKADADKCAVTELVSAAGVVVS